MKLSLAPDDDARPAREGVRLATLAEEEAMFADAELADREGRGLS